MFQFYIPRWPHPSLKTQLNQSCPTFANVVVSYYKYSIGYRELYSTVQYSTVQYNALDCIALHCTAAPGTCTSSRLVPRYILIILRPVPPKKGFAPLDLLRTIEGGNFFEPTENFRTLRCLTYRHTSNMFLDVCHDIDVQVTNRCSVVIWAQLRYRTFGHTMSRRLEFYHRRVGPPGKY
jgi:hypothetical protein